MYTLKDNKVSKIERTTFFALGMTENDIEELLRNSIDMLCDDEESLLIIGRQVKNERLGRSDLTAIDNNGKVVLIEIKRDKKDIKSRKEAFEFQAIRYAASYATIESVEELVKKVYAPYIDKYKIEFNIGELTSYELGIRKINEFLKTNDSDDKFNFKQRIILVASEFDAQTLSAVAWLNSNNVDISCFELIPFKFGEEVTLQAEKILPLTKYDDYYVNLLDNSSPNKGMKKQITRRSLPKIDAMLDWGVINAGDIIKAKGTENSAILLANGNVDVNGEEMSMQIWLKEIYGWSSVQTYAFAIHQATGKLLQDLRDEYMTKKATEVISE